MSDISLKYRHSPSGFRPSIAFIILLAPLHLPAPGSPGDCSLARFMHNNFPRVLQGVSGKEIAGKKQLLSNMRFIRNARLSFSLKIPIVLP
jgi:hypothetical protein